MKHPSRREFLRACGLTGAALFADGLSASPLLAGASENGVSVSAHLWVYASKFPPDWDCTPVLDQVFSDLKYAGLDGVEMMEVHLRHADAVSRIKSLIQHYKLPVTGISYYGDMWDRSRQQEILEDVEMVVPRLQALGGETFGITVGDAGHKKTEAELDAQGDVLKKIMTICQQHAVQPNLHNHTFEIADNLHDWKGTLERVPDLPLGPDLNWLVRGGVDPVTFINTFGDRMVYMHIRDQDAAGKWTEVVGEGATDFPAIANALKRVNFKGRVAIELALDAPPRNPLRDDWKKSREYVRKTFGW